MIKIVSLLLFVLVSQISVAEVVVHEFDTEAQRLSYVKLGEELRCPKCQNQNLSDSNSEIANIMRDVIAEELQNGKTESDIKNLMVDRYGDFVLYEPPITLETAVLWWGPIIFLCLAFISFIYIVVKRSKFQIDENEKE